MCYFPNQDNRLTTITTRVLMGFVIFSASPAFASVGGLDGLVAKLDEFNTWLIGLGSVIAVTGFIWACLAIAGQAAGATRAVSALVVGLAIANAKQIVGFFAS